MYDPRNGPDTVAVPWLPRTSVVVPGFGFDVVTVPDEAVSLIVVAV